MYQVKNCSKLKHQQNRTQKNIRETPLDRALAKVQKYLEKVLDSEQFRKLEKNCDNIVMKNEKELNEELLDMRKKGKMPVNFTRL